MPLATTQGVITTSAIFTNDCYGSLTQTADTAITRAIPPRAGARAKIAGYVYKAAGTAHTLTFLTTFSTTAIYVTSQAASGQAVVNISQAPTAADGTIHAAADWYIAQYEDGTWNELKVSSISGLAVTATANFSKNIPSGSRIYFMGAPADHANRQFTMVASTEMAPPTFELRGCYASAIANNEPILAHSDNATAAGVLRSLAYYYDPTP